MNGSDSLRNGLGAICVLDIETAPDPHALALAGLKRSKQTDDAAALHRIEDVSMLRAYEAPDGTWSEFRLSSYSAKTSTEIDVLEAIDEHLEELVHRGGALVTYNGLRHDLPVIRRRAARHLMMGAPWMTRDEIFRHYDVMMMAPGGRLRRWSKLRDTAAGLGIPVAFQLPTRGIGTATAGIRKSQVDVVATFLVMLYDVSMRRGSEVPIRSGWQALSRYIGAMGPHGDHLAQFTRHPLGIQ